MNNSARLKNSAPGIYFKETEIGYSAKSLGITSAGVAGETLKGPAFEPISISDWSEFQSIFGGTSTEKFKDSQYPKYELPFIAKSYLTESNRLEVVRVLGLSGYNAGPAWYIKANGKVIAVLRSKGHYEKYHGTKSEKDGCVIYSGYDTLVYDAKSINLTEYNSTVGELNCKTTYRIEGGSFEVTRNNYGKFVLEVTANDDNETVVKYAVSLNPGDRDYILTVLGTTADGSSALVYVEELYDVALVQGIYNGTITEIESGELEMEKIKRYVPVYAPVSDILSIPEEDLRRGNLGQTFLVDSEDNEIVPTLSESGVTAGDILEVQYTGEGYAYAKVYNGSDWASATSGVEIDEHFEVAVPVLYVNSYAKYFTFNNYNDENTEANPYVDIITNDFNNYKERFRSAMTPWFVSQLLGNGNDYEVKRLFRFITISDGNAANQMIKVSIEKIYPDEGQFDVVVRDYNDSDLEPIIIEKFSKCNMNPQSPNFIAKKIGTANGEFESKSDYIMVELADNDTIYNLVPCGFLGYPIRNTNAFLPLKYNTQFNSDIKPKKQYFGMSDIVGVDVDVLNYKGVSAYANLETTENGYSNAFHLDVRANIEETNLSGVTILVDGVSGYVFDTVSANSNTNNGAKLIPVITTEEEMSETIYEDVNLRKFTAYPYGGFDGWDVYRGKRTNTDEFKENKYKGEINNGEGSNFTTLFDRSGLGLEDIKCISSDYYAYLAGYRQFANPEAVDINLFATPGIDIINNTLLVDDVLDILEDEEDGRNGDCLYVPTTPDKPSGASDLEDDMYTPSEIVELVKDTTISDSYVTTFYPWVKYFDVDSGTYIMLPATKDALRDFAYVDNTSAPWFAAAGTKGDNGAVNCVKAHKFLKKADEGILYENSINPIKTFAQDGVKIWGNKTLYYNDNTPLNRTNVRRLMLRVKKLISSAGRVLIFDQNDGTLERQFRSIVEPILANVRDNRGILAYKLDVNNSQECEDEHELNCTIWIKPTPTLEWININFNITRRCVTFED